MASNVWEATFRCSACDKGLDSSAKTLPCLHSFCRSCVEGHIEGATLVNGECPQCHAAVGTRDQLRLSRRRLQSSDWCLEEGVESTGQIWCKVREEASKGKKRGPTLEQNLQELEMRVLEANERTRRSIDQLSRDCDCKSSKLWQDFEAFMEETRRKLGKLCDDMRETTREQERQWRLSLREGEALLEKVEIWRHTLRRLLRDDDDTDDEDVVLGLKLVGAELSSRLLRQSLAPARKVELVVTFPKWCHDSLESLRKEMIELRRVETPAQLHLERECRLQGSNLRLISYLSLITSIVAGDEDNLVFVGDWNGESILAFGETGELVGRCPLTDGGGRFYPTDMCLLSEDILVVCCPWGSGRSVGGRLFFLGRKKCPPFLETKKTIDTKEKEFFSLCQFQKKIFACEKKLKEIICLNENGEEIKTIRLGVSPWSGGWPRLRADPTTGNLWGTRGGTSEIFVWNQNGEILQKLETEEKILDFRANKFGFFSFSTPEGIFSLLPKKLLHKFPKRSEDLPRIFVSPQKLFLSFQNNGEKLLKIFKIN